jgi:hypothetical protein
MIPKVCYISNLYLGERRVEVQSQKQDRLLFLKTQILTLSEYKHNLSKIIFNFNLREQDIPYINEIIKLTPNQIQSTPVELIFRKNKGMSYGAWSDVFKKYQNEFDYYIFNEDDYFIHDHNFDQYLVNTFNQYKNCGYLCAVVYEGGNDYPKHAANCFGISSFEALNKVYQKYGRLLGEMDEYTQKHIGKEIHENGQVAHTNVFIKLGYDLYDVREKYKVLHSMGSNENNHFFELYFNWNTNHLILPAKAKFLEPINYIHKIEPQFQPSGLNNKYEKKVTSNN